MLFYYWLTVMMTAWFHDRSISKFIITLTVYHFVENNSFMIPLLYIHVLFMTQESRRVQYIIAFPYVFVALFAVIRRLLCCLHQIYSSMKALPSWQEKKLWITTATRVACCGSRGHTWWNSCWLLVRVDLQHISESGHSRSFQALHDIGWVQLL